MAKYQCDVESLIVEADNEEEAYKKAMLRVAKAGLDVHSIYEVD